jgi:hypothetical protein
VLAHWYCPWCTHAVYDFDFEAKALEHVNACHGPMQFVGSGDSAHIIATIRPTDSVMDEAWDLTTQDRHNQYGSAEDAFRAYGHIWTGLLQHKLADGAVIDATDVCLMMTGLKLAREVRNSKRDNVVDAHGYLSLLSRIRGWIRLP